MWSLVLLLLRQDLLHSRKVQGSQFWPSQRTSLRKSCIRLKVWEGRICKDSSESLLQTLGVTATWFLFVVKGSVSPASDEAAPNLRIPTCFLHSNILWNCFFPAT